MGAAWTPTISAYEETDSCSYDFWNGVPSLLDSPQLPPNTLSCSLIKCLSQCPILALHKAEQINPFYLVSQEGTRLLTPQIRSVLLLLDPAPPSSPWGSHLLCS